MSVALLCRRIKRTLDDQPKQPLEGVNFFSIPLMVQLDFPEVVAEFFEPINTLSKPCLVVGDYFIIRRILISRICQIGA